MGSKKIKKKILPEKNLKNVFTQEMLRVLKLLGMIDSWRRLSPELRDVFTSSIVRLPRFERDKNSGISAEIIDALKMDMGVIYDLQMVNIDEFNTSISLHDCLTVVISLLRSIGEFIDEDEPDYREWMKVGDALHNLINKGENNPTILFDLNIDNLVCICSEIEKNFYWFELTYHYSFAAEPYFCPVYTLKKTPAEKRYVCIDGNSRPVYRIGFPDIDKIEWASVAGKLLGENFGEEYRLPVYIQSHALERMIERLNPVGKPSIQLMLVVALENPEISSGPGGVQLIALRYYGAKIGYMVFDIVDNMIIIKTFLLITQNGTHEGNKLNREYNLSKYIKSYFELDKLYTYIKTDVYNDEELKKLFTQCGCGDLFNLWEKNDLDAMSFDENYAANLKKIFFAQN
ncbi:MAG TPA: hypothetical protein VHO70_04475 [Chitinispirillaceae bacterium]|nr:hypothetical protein [Chitinispirillaceae bacterium]